MARPPRHFSSPVQPATLLLAGSVIDVANFGSGFETVYSDLISSTRSNVITDTFVTPFGDFAIPTTFDAASGLLADTIAPF